MEIVFLIVGVLIGAVILYLFLQGKIKSKDTDALLLKQQMEQLETSFEQLKIEKEQKENEVKSLTNELTNYKIELKEAQTQLSATKEHHEKEARLREEQFEEQLKTMQEQFSNLATEVLEKTGEKLKATNNESMEHLTKPLQINLAELKEAIKHTNSETARSSAALSEQLKTMAEHTIKIDKTATQLTNVIRGGNKAQGNWGERMLTEILEIQGLKEGIDYDVQQALTDEKGNLLTNDDTGKRMIPDVVLHYPNNEDVVIDSKMSIDAYYQYVNTDDEALKRQYALDLVRSIRTQATNLAKKDYSKYIVSPRKAIDFVIMFVPNDGALQLALATEPKLWGEAFDKQVFITGQQNLMAILKMIRIAWRQYAQTENQMRVYALAEELLKRVGDFVKRFDKLGKGIDSLTKDYEEVYKKAYTGKQSIVQKAAELKELGVKESANFPIPQVNVNILDNEQD